jgi:hypothetical protein
VRYPADWHRAARSLTPHLTDPREVLSIATFPLRRGPAGPCAQAPVAALRALGPRDVLISFLERPRPAGEPPGRPRLGAAAPMEWGACAGRSERIEQHWTPFRLRGHGFYVFVGFGRRVTAERRRQAVQVLDSFRVRG